MKTYTPNTTPLHVIETLPSLTKGNLVLLDSLNDTKLPVKSYVDVMFLISDIVKVSRLALENTKYPETAEEHNASISRLLGIVEELIPYEEADLLDWMRENFL